jgi:alpha-amylase
MIIKKTPFKFMTPSEIADTLQPVAAINIPSPISWADEERDITAWLGNELQVAALDKLYELSDKVKRCNDPQMNRDWEYLQSSDHFYYMATKFFSDGAVHAYFNPYETPYDAFMNYMNVLSDFEIRVNRCLPDTHEQIEISRLDNMLHEKDRIIEKQAAEISTLSRKKVEDEMESDLPEEDPGTSLKDLANLLMKSSSSKKEKAGKKKVIKPSSGKTIKKKPAAKKTTKTVKKKRK